MALLLAATVAVTAAAALALTWALGAADDQVERLASAQRRFELLSAISGRVGDYALVALQAAEASTGGLEHLVPARDRVHQAFQRFDSEVGEEVSRLTNEAERTLVAARSRGVAHMRARFDVLDRQATAAVGRASLGQGGGIEALKVALDAFAAGFAPALGQAIEEERTAAQEAQAAMARLRERLTRGAGLAVVLALALSVLLYRALARPLLRRISDVAAGAAAIARGRFDTRLVVGGRDELSLAMARFNRMAAHLARREARLVADQRRLQDIVEARTAELRAANERLAATDVARRRFFTDVSHELRTPLTVILGEAEVTLRARQPRIEEMRAALQVIRARARRLHRRVEDLLRIARSETGQIELDLAAVDVGPVLEEAREGIEGLARSRGVSVAVEAAGPELAAAADRDWLRQVIEGLLANAIRHAPPGGTVRLAARPAGADIEIAVADEGCGIAAEDLPHVFERFYRGDGAERNGSGFGIGLALAKWIVEQHGGTISIASRTAASAEGPRGTVVTIRLPGLSRSLAGAAQ